MKNASFIAILILSIVACQPKYDKSQLDKVAFLDEMSIKASDSFNSIDSNLAISESAIYKGNILYLKNSMQDTLDNKTLAIIKEYYGLKKGFDLLQTNYLMTKEELAISKKQLQDLTHDLENELLEAKQLDDYIELEMKNLGIILETSEKMITSSNIILPAFEKLNPTIDSLIISSKEKLKQE